MSCIHTIKYDNLQLWSWQEHILHLILSKRQRSDEIYSIYYPFLPTITLILHLTNPATTSFPFSFFFLFFNSSLNPVMCMSVKSFTGMWESRWWTHRQKEMTNLPHPPTWQQSLPNSSSVVGEAQRLSTLSMSEFWPCF